MPKWASTILILIVFLVVADYVLRRRVTAMAEWRQARGFDEIKPFVPTEDQPVLALASLVTNRDSGGLPWAGVYAGMSDGTRVTLAELSYSPSAGHTSRWFTLAVWPEPAARGPLLLNQGTKQTSQHPWLTEARRKAIDAWPYGGRFVVIDGYVGWLTEGLLTAGRADKLLGQIGEARRAMAGR